MKLKWIEDKNTKGKYCAELDEEFNIHLAVFKCVKGTTPGLCNVDNDKFHWVGTVGIYMGPGIKVEGHASSEKQAIKDVEKHIINLLSWRKEYWENYNNTICNHIQNIDKCIKEIE